MAKYGFKVSGFSQHPRWLHIIKEFKLCKQDGQGLGKQEQGMSIALQVEKTSKRGGRIIHEKELMLPPAAPSPPPPIPQIKELPTITEIMKAPSKVVLLRVNVFYLFTLFGHWNCSCRIWLVQVMWIMTLNPK